MAGSKRLRIGVIVDRQQIARWQNQALLTIAGKADLLVYSCRNTVAPQRRLKFLPYYLLNLLTIRNHMTRRRPWPVDLPVVATYEFDAIDEGGWQRLPTGLIEQLRSDRIDVLLKFGMGLLRVPAPDDLPLPILSYHHGDPAEFRGRPAGFYEMLSGKSVLGQVVQRLSNDLDAGDIVASAQTRIAPHSYRGTLIEAYRHSPIILRGAIDNAVAGRRVKLASRGRNYRLPTGSQVQRLVLAQWSAAAKRLLYGLFMEKHWQVATAALPDKPTTRSVERALSEPVNWQVLPTPSGYRFLADPFFHPAGGLLVEGLNRSSCQGEILNIDDGEARRLSGRGGHYSYPAYIGGGGLSYIVPEISDWSPAKAFLVSDDGLGEALELKIPGRPALLDPTPYHDGNTLYLFGNRADEGPSVLRLWIASGLQGEFSEHLSSPIRLSPNGARMAGSLVILDGGLHRVGQDLRGRYGDGITIFRVTRIDRDCYSEEEVFHFRFPHVRGPHTLNVARDNVAFDFHVDRFSIVAGIRRMMEKRAARRIR